MIATILLACEAPSVSREPEVASPSPLHHPLESTERGLTPSAADLRSPPHILEPDLEISGAEADLVWIADLAGLADGSFLLLDRSTRMVLLWEDGRLREIAGGEGEGPGEFSDPVALAAGPDGFAVLDRAALRVSWFRLDGTHVVTRTLDEPGDLPTAWARGPMRGVYSPYYGHVDFAERLHSADGGVLLELEDNEFLSYSDDQDRRPRRRAYLVHLTPAASPDTVLSFDAPPLRIDGGTSGGIRAVGPPIYHPPRAWHANEDHLVVVAPENGSLEIRRVPSDEPALEIEWPGNGPVSREDQVNAQLWALQRWVPHFTTQEARDRYRSERAREEYAERNADLYEYSEVRPAITEVFLGDPLLWIAGFSSEDSPEGISATWTLLDPAAEEVVGRLRFPSPGERLRDIEGCLAYTTNVDDGGLFVVRRYRLPDWACG